MGHDSALQDHKTIAIHFIVTQGRFKNSFKLGNQWREKMGRLQAYSRILVLILIGIYCIIALGWNVTYTKIILLHIFNVPVFPSEALLCILIFTL